MKPISDYLKECSGDWDEVGDLLRYCANLENAIIDARESESPSDMYYELHSITELEDK